MESEYAYFDSAEGQELTHLQCISLLWDHRHTERDTEEFYPYFMEHSTPKATTSKQGIEYIKRYIDAQTVLAWLGY